MEETKFTETQALFALLNEYFDKIYVITLKSSTYRHALFQNVFDGLDYQIFYGVDGNRLELSDLEEQGIYHPRITELMKKRIGKNPSGMSPTRVGCTLSHLKIYEETVKNGYRKVLILEDDPLLVIDNVESVKKAFSELPEDWELLYLGHGGANSHPSTLLKLQRNLIWLFAVLVQRFERLRRLDPDVIRCWFARPYSEHLDLSGTHFGAYAYAISAKGAEKLLNYQTPVVQEIDNLLAELCSYEWIRAFNLKNQLFFSNRNVPSTINPKLDEPLHRVTSKPSLIK